MRFWLFAAAISLSAFAAVALAASLAVTWMAPAIARRLERYSPASRAAILFRVRMVPAALAVLVAFGMALPIFAAYEPRETDETLARTLLALAAAGLAVVGCGIWRAGAAWQATARVRRAWERTGRTVNGFGSALPVFAIDEPYPTVAVVGIARPALFISERVLRECTAGEIDAMLRHEAAHVAVRDNLKRFLLRACPDVVLTGGALDRAWSAAAEEAADAAAVAGRPASALELAGALIRVARLAPARPPALVSAFYLGGSIESRVRRLVSPQPASEPAPALGRGFVVGAAFGLATLIAVSAPLLHRLMERVVSQLP